MMKNLRELRHILDKLTKSDSDYSSAKVLNQVYLCLDSGQPTFSDFLDPQRRNAIQHALKPLATHGFLVTEEGGYPNAERKMLGLALAHTLDSDAPPAFPIVGILLEHDPKFGALSHRDILGAVLGLGLSRDVVGDVIFRPNDSIVFIKSQIADFILCNLHKIGRVTVSAIVLPADTMLFPLDNKMIERITCASMRLDAILSAAFKLSRGDVATLVKSGKAHINWQIAQSPAKIVTQGDMLTLRRHGRVQIKEICGKSRKDRFIIDIIRY